MSGPDPRAPHGAAAHGAAAHGAAAHGAEGHGAEGHGEAAHGEAAHGAEGHGGAGGIRALAITVSNRASAGVYADKSGPVLAELLRDSGCSVEGPIVVPDGEPVEEALREAIGAGYDVVVTTGGTGLTPGDRTPEMTRRVLDREIPGIAEAIRSAGAAAGIASAILSRGLAGLAGQTLIVNLPGSAGGVRDGMGVLAGVLGHAVDQARGGDHPRPS
jgi:molybdenum cofactor synthesis domain-containing protein